MKHSTSKSKTVDLFESENTVNVNYGRLLEDQLMKWKGGSYHDRGIAEYITNSDDSYRRLKKYKHQNINVEIHSKRGRKIDKLLISDTAEGMSYEDLENKFFQYFESYSGREKGLKVTGQFGTGGKAYAIMNFKDCWITSVKDGYECKAWFKWDASSKTITKGYNGNGYKNKKVNKPNGTTIELLNCLKNNLDLMSFVVRLNELPRIRHIIKHAQIVNVKVFQKSYKPVDFNLEYVSPSGKQVKEWRYGLPVSLKNEDSKFNELVLRYFEEPIDNHSNIDLSDGISSVADLPISKYDNRPFSKYVNGDLTITRLQNSTAVKENRKGLEEQNDLTIEIEDFLKEKIGIVITEIQEEQRKKEVSRRKEVSNEKIKELNKFLKKCELNFHDELSNLQKLASEDGMELEDTNLDTEEFEEGFRKLTEDDIEKDLIKGNWGGGDKPSESKSENDSHGKFNPDDTSDDIGVKDNTTKKPITNKPRKRGIQVLMSDDQNIPEKDRPVLSEFEEPVVDKDMTTQGIIWINANNPIIVKYQEKKENEELFKEVVATYVLLVVAIYQTQIVLNTQPEGEREDTMPLFRQKFFLLQRLLREDKEISYFENKKDSETVLA